MSSSMGKDTLRGLVILTVLILFALAVVCKIIFTVILFNTTNDANLAIQEFNSTLTYLAGFIVGVFMYLGISIGGKLK